MAIGSAYARQNRFVRKLLGGWKVQTLVYSNVRSWWEDGFYFPLGPALPSHD